MMMVFDKLVDQLVTISFILTDDDNWPMIS